MRYHAVAVDYDGTLASGGAVEPATRAALIRLRRSGRRLILVTGRQLADLRAVFPDIGLCERVVAENGAMLYRPQTHEERPLADPPPEAFAKALRARGVDASAGQIIVATHQPHEGVVLETIRDLGLELQLIFNKGAVMVLPTGVNKATGLRAALDELGLSLHNVVAVGDAENDHAFMAACECGVAVANALPVIREYADWVTPRERGGGVEDLIELLLVSDLAEFAPRLVRHEIVIGRGANGHEVRIPPYGHNLLVSGTSGGGKSTFATAFVEVLAAKNYQYCVIDPEGDYQQIEGAVTLGDSERAPTLNEALDLLEDPGRNVVVNLLGIAREHRPAFFERLLPALSEMRARAGRPHWIVVDETHHLMPALWERVDVLPQALHGLMLITVHPDHVAQTLLQTVNTVVAIGAEPARTIATFASALGVAPPGAPGGALDPGEALVWTPQAGREVTRFRTIAPRAERRRHLRKYAEGDLGVDRSFYFRGSNGRLNLRAQNLAMFLQIADGIDDETWLHHLHRRDYSRWFREAIKDEALARAAERVESEPTLSARDSRARIRKAVERCYTAPA